VDVLTLDMIWVGPLAPKLADLGPGLGAAAKLHFPAMIRHNTFNGRLVALPVFTDVGVLYYRKDLLGKYGYQGPPTTYGELERMARAIQAGERRQDPLFSGYIWQGRPYEGLTCNALEWQANQGGNQLVGQDPRRATVGNARAIAAFRRAAGWVGTISPALVLTYDELDTSRVFGAGHAAFMRGWGDMVAALNARGSAVAGRFAIAALPHEGPGTQGAGVLGGWQVGVAGSSRHVAEAIELARYLASPEVQAYRAELGGFLPTIPAVYQLQRVRGAQPLLQAFPAHIQGALYRPSNRIGAGYPEFSGLYFQGIAAILRGNEADVVTALMQQDLDHLLAGRLPDR
jgi:trehalose/maltose transport system substrate-binding protein